MRQPGRSAAGMMPWRIIHRTLTNMPEDESWICRVAAGVSWLAI
jgi:hypothetical protein